MRRFLPYVLTSLTLCVGVVVGRVSVGWTDSNSERSPSQHRMKPTETYELLVGMMGESSLSEDEHTEAFRLLSGARDAEAVRVAIKHLDDGREFGDPPTTDGRPLGHLSATVGDVCRLLLYRSYFPYGCKAHRPVDDWASWWSSHSSKTWREMHKEFSDWEETEHTSCPFE